MAVADSGAPPALLLEELAEPAKPEAAALAGTSAPCAAPGAPAAGTAATPAADEADELAPLLEQPASPQPQMMVPAIVPAMSTRARCAPRRRCLSN